MEALNGHLSLSHANYANDDDIMETGKSVGEWKSFVRESVMKEKYTRYMHEHNMMNMERPWNMDDPYPFELPDNGINKYSGYVYDAVWLYALSLENLIKQNKSYIQVN